jgi:hypothetical protein
VIRGLASTDGGYGENKVLLWGVPMDEYFGITHEG